jgi:hypothetical protein
MNHSQIVGFIWGVADLIRDTFKRQHDLEARRGGVALPGSRTLQGRDDPGNAIRLRIRCG